ncbi:MAG TPA: YggS family pyridoxal phosphate-dependent enzyme [Chloroflexota bacterium]|nr:YggS family pyridoxal phosphate-dependent enzyme [Chloroflexota bacterium]
MVHGTETNDALPVRLQEVRARIAGAAQRGGRPASAITLVAVTKTIPADVVRAAALAGIVDVGENRVQEAATKIPALADGPPLRWHLIGHLQRNKVRRATELFDVMHSIDDVALAGAVARAAAERSSTLEAFVQVNMSGEATKSGFAPDDLRAHAATLAALPHLHWRGLMTIAPAGADERALRQIFGASRALQADLAASFDTTRWNALSMGMSDDFELAIEEGATHVRVGRAIFGERPQARQE